MNYYLFSEDADTILTILEILDKEKHPLKDIQIRNMYFNAFFERVKMKAEISSYSNRNKMQTILLELYKQNRLPRKDSSNKQNKHLIPPRLAWMVYLGVIDKTKEGYIISDKGKLFYESLPSEGLKDINKKWIYDKLFTSCSILYNQNEKTDCKYIEQSIARNLLDLYNQMYNDKAMRISLLPALLYVSMSLIMEQNIILNFTDIEKYVQNLKFDKFSFSLNKTGRVNESYISIHLI